MPKAKTFKSCFGLVVVMIMTMNSHAQAVLGQVIDQTKQTKLRQLSPRSAGAQGASEDVAPPSPPTLWSISGVNNQLVGEIWQGDSVYRLPLVKGAKLPTGWEVVATDKQSVTLKLGSERRKLTPAAKGSTGWEYPQTPRTAAAAMNAANSPAARTAASNLPPMAMPPSQASAPNANAPSR
jgi:hypothetical protein